MPGKIEGQIKEKRWVIHHLANDPSFYVNSIYAVLRFRVRAAFLAATDRTCAPFVLAAFFAAADRDAAERFLAAVLACFESASCETVDVGSRFNAFTLARDRFLEIGSCFWPFL
jgi:hypothetical protein